ncbi:MAG: CorA family divalent cation transporter [Prolixibacteraceae bacterium]
MKNAVINSFYIDSVGKTATKIDPDSLPAIKHENDYVWLQLNFSVPEVKLFLQPLNINESAIHALTKAESRPRVAISNEELLLIVRGVNKIKGEKPENMISVRILATRNLLISCQKKNLMSIQNLLADIEQGNPPLSTGDFIVRLNERIVVNMGDTMENIEERAIAMEERVMDDSRNDYKPDLHHLRRQIIQLKRFLIPQRDALNKLQLDKTNWMTSKQQIRLREVGDYLLRYLEVLEASRELAAVSMEMVNQRQNEQLNKRMYLLSLIAALFLPLSFFSGLFGVNLSGIPLADRPYAFPLFVLILLLIVLGMFRFFKRNKWL